MCVLLLLFFVFVFSVDGFIFSKFIVVNWFRKIRGSFFDLRLVRLQKLKDFVCCSIILNAYLQNIIYAPKNSLDLIIIRKLLMI